jgi:hypothetical protein
MLHFANKTICDYAGDLDEAFALPLWIIPELNLNSGSSQLRDPCNKGLGRIAGHGPLSANPPQNPIVEDMV